jgi:hypothetical protein
VKRWLLPFIVVVLVLAIATPAGANVPEAKAKCMATDRLGFDTHQYLEFKVRTPIADPKNTLVLGAYYPAHHVDQRVSYQIVGFYRDPDLPNCAVVKARSEGQPEGDYLYVAVKDTGSKTEPDRFVRLWTDEPITDFTTLLLQLGDPYYALYVYKGDIELP